MCGPVDLLHYADQTYQFAKDGRVTQKDPNEYDGAAEGFESSRNEDSAANPAQPAAEISDGEDPDMPQVQAEHEEVLDESKGKLGDFSLYSYYLGSAGYIVLFAWLLFAMTAAVGEWSPGWSPVPNYMLESHTDRRYSHLLEGLVLKVAR